MERDKGKWAMAGVRALLVVAPLLAAGGADALQIEGTQPYALDQPRVPALLRPAGGGPPLSTTADLIGQELFAFECFLDTGATRMTLSRTDRAALGVEATGQTVEDWGIGGAEEFDVSEPYRFCVGDSGADILDAAQFPLCMRASLQLRRSDTDLLQALPKNLSEQLVGGQLGLGNMEGMFTVAINIVGTPFLEDHVAVIDPRPVAEALALVVDLTGGGGRRDVNRSLDRLLKALESNPTGLGRMKLDLIAADAAYPEPDITVPLALKDVEEGELPVTSARAPFIEGVQLTHRDAAATASMLLDTGGAVTILSPKVAQELNLDLDNPSLSAPIMGIGEKGGRTLRGYWIDAMSLPTKGTEPVSFRRVPVFVEELRDLDGVLGMNMLAPSVYLDMDMQKLEINPMALLGSLRAGAVPFRRIVVDLPRRRLGLDPLRATTTTGQ